MTGLTYYAECINEEGEVYDTFEGINALQEAANMLYQFPNDQVTLTLVEAKDGQPYIGGVSSA